MSNVDRTDNTFESYKEAEVTKKKSIAPRKHLRAMLEVSNVGFDCFALKYKIITIACFVSFVVLHLLLLG
jgi:hypothetical protein